MPSTTENLELYLPDAGQSGVANQLNQNWSTLDGRFDEATGHTHSGAEGQGPKIPVTSLSAGGTPTSSTFLRGDGAWASGGGGTGVTDHGELTGLGDDDHAQYYNQARGDSRYAQRSNNLSDLVNPAAARTNLGAAAAVHQHAAADISSGTVATARLGSGTANATTYLRGDQTWQPVSGSGGAGTLDDLTDVLIVAPAEGQLLQYVAAASRWENVTPTPPSVSSEQIDDRVAALIVAGTGITSTYDDTANTLTIAASSGGGSSALDPVTTLQISDDFVTGGTTTGTVGALGWGFTQGSVSYIDSEANHPGILRRGTSTSANQVCPVYPHAPSLREVVPSDTFDLRFIARLSRTTDIVARLGLLRNPDSNPPTDGIYLEKLAADTAYMFVTRAASVETRVSSGVTATIDWFKIRIRRINPTTIGFTLNAAAEVTATATIPTLPVSPCFHVFTTTTAATGIEVDLISLAMTGLTR